MKEREIKTMRITKDRILILKTSKKQTKKRRNRKKNRRKRNKKKKRKKMKVMLIRKEK